ncbi:unnamed protein product [Protopolystoma xenopodis]|uniref:RanBP2-type domain-containing protein n=1 Tax=Protopolystoma xenopodis TaxID=117903 RepID=A0A448WSS3_9PLAT|nr:unnamed protein product [Protopolystoma xenopodis]
MQELHVLPNDGSSHKLSPRPEAHDTGMWICPQCTYRNWPKARKCVQCLCASPFPLETEPPPSKRHHLPVHPSSMIDKWPCTVCTYENWPKTRKCIMCHSFRPISSPSIAEEVHVDYGNDCNAAIPANSLRRRKGPSQGTLRDGLWLDACRAVLEGEFGPIERYFASGGRLDRRLSKQVRFLYTFGYSEDIRIFFGCEFTFL